MRYSWVISAEDGTYETKAGNLQVANMQNFSQCSAHFAFFDDEACTIPSTSVAGTLTLKGKVATYSPIWQDIPDGALMDMGNPESLYWGGPVAQLQAIVLGMTNTDFIKIDFDRQAST